MKGLMTDRLLIVDDDKFLQENLRKLFEKEGFEVETATSGEDGMSLMEQRTFDLLILDLGLPGDDGIVTCKRVRKRWNFPVLMLTARSELVDKITGFEVGADDYLTKPFDPTELVARVRAHLRRANQYKKKDTDSGTFGRLEIDFERRDAYVDGKAVNLTNREFELLAFLARNPDRAVSRGALFKSVWGYDMDFNSNSLDVYIYRIRKKIEKDPNDPLFLQTMRGYGYKLVAVED